MHDVSFTSFVHFSPLTPCLPLAADLSFYNGWVSFPVAATLIILWISVLLMLLFS